MTKFGLEVSGHFGTKKATQEKSAKFIKIFELYKTFMYNFLYQNDPMPSIINY